MKLTSNEARTILENFRGTTKSDKWIDHCICVGDTAGKIAQALVEKGYNVDIDKTITLGYLHDIGKYNGKSHGHEISGYNYLKDKGYDEEYYNICITHSYLNNDIICTAGGVPNLDDKTFIAEFIKKHKYTIEEKLINLCDLIVPSAKTTSKFKM